MGQTSYEVQVMQGGRWRIHAQFPENGHDDAIGEARTLETLPGIAGIKVVRDTYDDRTGMHNPKTVYKHTPKPSENKPDGKYAKYQNRINASRGEDIDDPFAEAPSKKKKKKSSGMGVIVKMLLVLLFSIALSAVMTGLVNGFLPSRIGDIRLVGATRANAVVGSAIIFFLLSVSVSFYAFMGRDELSSPEFERKKKQVREKSQKKKKDASQLKTNDEKRAKKEMVRLKKEKQKRKEQEEARKAQEKAAQQEDEQNPKEPEQEEPQEETPKEETQEGDDGFSRLSPMAEKQKASLMAFFGEAVRNLPPERKKMDNYNRFGLNLFLAGAAEALGGERNLDGETITLILADSLQTMGLKEEHAEAFARRYEDYLLQDPRYMEIFQSARRSISDFMGGKKSAVKDLEHSLDEWNKPKAQEDPEKEVVVMFTDIVGSTAMTHEKGNLAAQEVVRAHNRVVRDALAKTGGKEIKHTGDGIMASFENVTKSLLATQQMQMMIRMHNTTGPELPLKVKIGINAGRVVMEERDLYGVTVQMAARIVDKASDGQIFVSDTVYGLAQGGQWRFVKRGPYYMKGINGKVFLQELVWDDKADITALNAHAIAERPALENTYAITTGNVPDEPKPTPEPEQDPQQASAQTVQENAKLAPAAPAPVAAAPAPATQQPPPAAVTPQAQPVQAQPVQAQPVQAQAAQAYAQSQSATQSVVQPRPKKPQATTPAPAQKPLETV